MRANKHLQIASFGERCIDNTLCLPQHNAVIQMKLLNTLRRIAGIVAPVSAAQVATPVSAQPGGNGRYATVDVATATRRLDNFHGIEARWTQSDFISRATISWVRRR